MNSNRIRIIAFTLLGLLLYPLFYLLSGRVKVSDALLDAFISDFIFSVLAYTLYYSARYTGTEKQLSTTFFVNHLVTGIIFSFVWVGLASVLVNSLLGINPGSFTAQYKQTMLWKNAAGLTFYIIVQLVLYLLMYYEESARQIERESELRNKVTEAELKNLKFQINPHFLFNSLNSITALIMMDSGKAREMTISLSEFLRSTLSNNIRQTHTLEEELKSIRLYLSIEKIRFEERFQFREEINPELFSCPVPNMILQPLLENAVKYSVYESLDAVEILLKAEQVQNGVKLTVENDYEETNVPSMKKGEGVGLVNVRSRLELFYKGEARMNVIKDEKRYSVILYIPCTEKTQTN